MQIQKLTVENIGIVQHLAETIWPQVYSSIISAAQIRYMLDMMYSKESLKQQLDKGHQFILAMQDDNAIGFAAFSQKSTTEPSIFRLHKLYVLPQLHTKGVGSFLLDYVKTTSKSQGANTLELNVNRNNPAIHFYNKKGFTVLREEVLDIGDGYVMDDYVMVLAL
jgi:ribosomal protein S18 acetylase RimI-like enzyme